MKTIKDKWLLDLVSGGTKPSDNSGNSSNGDDKGGSGNGGSAPADEPCPKQWVSQYTEKEWQRCVAAINGQ